MSGRRSLEGLDDDIRDHIERETRENVERGMTPDEARYAALRAFGNVTIAREDTRAVWDPVWVQHARQDARYGLRMLRRSPGFAAVASLTLAIGIGMNTAVFSVFNAVLLRPVAYPHADRLVSLSTVAGGGPFSMEFVPAADLVRWRQQATTFDRLVAYDHSDQTIVTADTATQARLAWVSDEFWDFSGARPVLGRLPAAGERDVLVLSHGLFERRFSSDPGAVGRAVLVQGRQVVIAGVLPREFRFQLPRPSRGDEIDFKEIEGYRPLIVDPQTVRGGPSMLINAAGRLKPDATIDRARAELEAIRAGLARSEPNPVADRMALRVVPMQERLVGQARLGLWILLAAVIVVLLVACANVASLLLARASARQKEIAIRAAVGAGRARLVRQLLVESAVLGVLGGAGGLLLGRLALIVLVRFGPQAVPRLTESSIDARVLAFACALTIATAILFGLGPALSLWKVDLHDVLKDGVRTASAALPGVRLRRLLVAIELALAVVLLSGAGLLTKSLWRMQAYPAGFNPEQILVMKVRFSGPHYRAPAPRRAYAGEALRRLQGVPGVRSVSLSTGRDQVTGVRVEGRRPRTPDEIARIEPAQISATSRSLAETLGLRMVSGRWLTDAEPSPVVVINETVARREFPGQDPIGARLQLRLEPNPDRPTFATIVGVVANLKYSKLDAEPGPELYIPYAASPDLHSFTLVVRTEADPLAAAPTIRKLVADIDRTQPVFDMMTLEQALADSVAPRRFNLWLLGAFAAAALALAVIGVYGVIAYLVSQRTHEIGVRIALGARRRDVVGMVIAHGMAMAVAGISAGLGAALVLTRVMTTLLYEVESTDPATFAAVASMLSAVALAACAAPALRAAAVDPVVALRCE